MKNVSSKIFALLLTGLMISSIGCSSKESLALNKDTTQSDESSKTVSANSASLENAQEVPKAEANEKQNSSSAAPPANQTKAPGSTPPAVATTPQAATPVVTNEKSIEELITAADPANANRNIANYNKLLADYSVPELYKGEIKKALINGYKPEDVFVAYEILYSRFGDISDMDNLLSNHVITGSWRQAYWNYVITSGKFQVHNYAAGYLDMLEKQPGIVWDTDCKIAEWVNYRTGSAVEDLLQQRINGQTWAEINLERHIANFGHVVFYGSQYFSIETKIYTSADSMYAISQAASLICSVYNLDPAAVRDQLRNHLTITDITADYFVSKYTK